MTQFKIVVCVFLQNEANFSSSLQRALLFAREVGALNGLSPERSQYACYFAWQLRAQVWAWLSPESRHGVLNVTGQLRLQDAAWFEQFAMQASEEPWASRKLPSPIDPLSANALPTSANRTAVAKVNFMWPPLLCLGSTF
jgi:hypothetical protein